MYLTLNSIALYSIYFFEIIENFFGRLMDNQLILRIKFSL